MQARVRPEIRDKARSIADACGVSLSLVLEKTLEHMELDVATGRPVWWDDVLAAEQEEVQDRLVS